MRLAGGGLGHAAAAPAVGGCTNDGARDARPLPRTVRKDRGQRADIDRLQQRYADVFSPRPGRTSLIQHRVETHPGVTVRSRPYRLPEQKRKVFRQN